jgi:CRP-like cAMP-binding protein
MRRTVTDMDTQSEGALRRRGKNQGKADNTRTNRLLGALSQRNCDKFIRGSHEVELRFGDVLSTADQRMPYVYFPLTGFVSLLADVGERGRLEVGLVGREGMLGASIGLGVEAAAHDALVQGAGIALRMRSHEFSRYLATTAQLESELKRYVFVGIQQLALTAACTRFHLVEARLARWLLMTRDRANSDQFHLTHEYMAFMLGIRRVGVTTAAGALQARGLIKYNRGDILILSVTGLQRAACSCYRRGNQIYENQLGAMVSS